MPTRIERSEGCVAEGAANTTGTELDAAKNSRNDEQSLEIVLPQQFEELHSRPADLAIVPRLLSDLPVFVPHPARPTVVTRFVVLLFARGELFLDFVERCRRHRRGIEARTLLGDVVLGKSLDSWHRRKNT